MHSIDAAGANLETGPTCANQIEPAPALSLVAFDRASTAAEFIASAAADLRYELSYTMTGEDLRALEERLRGRVVSVHACCPATECFPNFASADPEVAAASFRDMDETLATAERFGASIVVLHPGYATDCAMPSSYAARKAILALPEFSEGVMHAEGSICGPGYNLTERYRGFAVRAMDRLGELAERYRARGVRVAAENLNPRAGYLFHTPEEMAEIAAIHPNLGLCLDVGHLYISSFAYGFDFLDGVRRIIATGKVLTCHLHGNSSGPDRFRDDHQSLDRDGFPFEEVLGILRGSGANLVLELLEEPARNLRLLERILAEKPGVQT
ncbi:sugar phosphate isomerase/epimerase [bacterium]|nr:sugar phosphate isomerase/epimerase [bacterium]